MLRQRGQKEFNRSPRRGEAGVEFNLLLLQQLPQHDKQLVDVELEPCLDREWIAGLDQAGDAIETGAISSLACQTGCSLWLSKVVKRRRSAGARISQPGHFHVWLGRRTPTSRINQQRRLGPTFGVAHAVALPGAGDGQVAAFQDEAPLVHQKSVLPRAKYISSIPSLRCQSSPQFCAPSRPRSLPWNLGNIAPARAGRDSRAGPGRQPHLAAPHCGAQRRAPVGVIGFAGAEEHRPARQMIFHARCRNHNAPCAKLCPGQTGKQSP